MGLSRNPDALKLTNNDPIPSYLGNKVVAGPGIKIGMKTDRTFGFQAVFLPETGAVGGGGDVVEITSSRQIPNTASLVLVSSATESVVVTLPHPAEVVGWLSIVCIDNTNGITLESPDQNAELVVPETGGSAEEGGKVVNIRTGIFDSSNTEFHAPGDSLVFASNRRDTWFCISRYSAQWY